jgi:hypothetical protein
MNTYIYFDMDAGIFIFTTRRKYDSKYILLPITELIALLQCNIMSVRRYVIKHKHSNSFLYHSTKEIVRLSMPKEYVHTKKSLYHKPQGLWISCGTSWLDHVEKTYDFPHKYNLFTYTYKIDIFDTVKIISEKEELHKFIKKFKKKPDDIRLYDIIDWEKVKTEHTGLIITPFLANKIWRESHDTMKIHGAESAHDFFCDLLGAKWKNNMLLLSEWYRAWECSCGVIWNQDGIASFKLLKRTDYSKYLI